MKIALCQINPTVGDLAGNCARILGRAHRAARDGARIAVFPELCVTGYPPMDLLDRPAFLQNVQDALDYLVAEAPAGIALIVGAPVMNTTPRGKRLFNDAIVIERGRIVDQVSKTLLPTYDVFDEYRYFEPCLERKVVEVAGLRLGLHICEDMWNNEEQAPYHLYKANPIDELAAKGIDLFVNISASPYCVGKPEERAEIIAESCREHGVPFVYVNTVGANTELIFDGDSRVHGASGEELLRLSLWREDYAVWDMAAHEAGSPEASQGGGRRDTDDIAEIHDALVLGIRDYVRKTGEGVFEKALIGLSGGIDSAVTCALAAEALGPDRVIGVTMPSVYSSGGSVDDSRDLADNLGIEFHEVSIRPAVDAFHQMLTEPLAGPPTGVTEENIQARARGLTLMAISNAEGHLLLTTGNKSEMAVGYATLYGDMSGGLAVLSDVFKEQVYALARHINEREQREIVPENTITKPPSAELRPDQMDSDSLPSYDVLDEILRRYVEDHESPEAIVEATGFERETVARIARMVDRNEYKRRQAAPGLRISSKAFGIGRRLPIVMQRTQVEPVASGGSAAPEAVESEA